MRDVNSIIIHCSDSDLPSHDNIETIRQWHTLRGFTGPDGVSGTHDDVAYHYFIRKSGETEKGRDEDFQGAHTKGHNLKSIGICLSGKDNFTKMQFEALEVLLIDILSRHDLDRTSILAHNELDKSKTCPNFDLDSWLKSRDWY